MLYSPPATIKLYLTQFKFSLLIAEISICDFTLKEVLGSVSRDPTRMKEEVEDLFPATSQLISFFVNNVKQCCPRGKRRDGYILALQSHVLMNTCAACPALMGELASVSAPSSCSGDPWCEKWKLDSILKKGEDGSVKEPEQASLVRDVKSRVQSKAGTKSLLIGGENLTKKSSLM